MLPNDKIYSLLSTLAYLCESRTQHQFNIEFDDHSYTVDGYHLGGIIGSTVNPEFYLWRGNMFAISGLYANEEHFMLFWLGGKFKIDQNTGVELPAEYYDDIKKRLDIGF